MTIYELGDTVTLTQAGAVDDDAQLHVTAPDGTESTPTVTFSSPNWSGSVTADQYDVWLYAWRLDGAIVTQGTFTVGGPWYATIAQMRAEHNVATAQTARDLLLARALTSASRFVDRYCDSRPEGAFLLDDTETAKTYRPTTRGPQFPGVMWCTEHGYRLFVHEVGATGYTVETSDDGTTWTELVEDTDYHTYPDNALVLDRPIEAFVSETAWPAYVRVTARWGWPSVPAEVVEATLRQSQAFYSRKDSPYGVAGVSDFGVIRIKPYDPHVQTLLAPWHTEALIA